MQTEEFKKVVFQLGELAHQVEEFIELYAEQMETLLAVQEMMGITEHDIKRDMFKLMEGGKSG
jgi:hypothetical protein